MQTPGSSSSSSSSSSEEEPECGFGGHVLERRKNHPVVRALGGTRWICGPCDSFWRNRIHPPPPPSKRRGATKSRKRKTMHAGNFASREAQYAPHVVRMRAALEVNDEAGIRKYQKHEYTKKGLSQSCLRRTTASKRRLTGPSRPRRRRTVSFTLQSFRFFALTPSGAGAHNWGKPSDQDGVGAALDEKDPNYVDEEK